jgi:hypothetical protein
MDQPANYLPYESTGFFSSIVTDYLSGAGALRPFYPHRPDADGIRNAITARKAFPQQRRALVEALREQYKGMAISSQVQQHIDALLADNTFTLPLPTSLIFLQVPCILFIRYSIRLNSLMN